MNLQHFNKSELLTMIGGDKAALKELATSVKNGSIKQLIDQLEVLFSAKKTHQPFTN